MSQNHTGGDDTALAASLVTIGGELHSVHHTTTIPTRHARLAAIPNPYIQASNGHTGLSYNFPACASLQRRTPTALQTRGSQDVQGRARASTNVPAKMRERDGHPLVKNALRKGQVLLVCTSCSTAGERKGTGIW